MRRLRVDNGGVIFTETLNDCDQEKKSSHVKNRDNESTPGTWLSIASAIRNEITRRTIEFWVGAEDAPGGR